MRLGIWSPNVGVAMVRIGDIHKDHYGKHFMTDLHGDSNMGREQVMDKRRGPFRSEKGPSRFRVITVPHGGEGR